MNWLNLVRHDLRSGLLRWRYLVALLLFAVPCFAAFTNMLNANCTGSWMDYLLCCFQGMYKPLGMDTFSFPVVWFLVVVGILFLNLDYPLNDLTQEGQQVIVRCVNKQSWFFAKCAWCVLSCVVYVLLAMVTALIFALITGGSPTLRYTPGVPEMALNMSVYGEPSVGQALAAAVGFPLLTLVTLNFLQMVLSLMMKPIFSFFICTSLVGLTVFVDSPLMLGNGAMCCRNGILLLEGQHPVSLGLACLAVIGICLVVGLLRFDRMDHLKYEG